MSGPELLPERAAGGGDQQVGAAVPPQRPHVGPVVDGARQDRVLTTMSGMGTEAPGHVIGN